MSRGGSVNEIRVPVEGFCWGGGDFLIRRVVAVTDHYRVNTAEGLWEAARAAGLIVFPAEAASLVPPGLGAQMQLRGWSPLARPAYTCPGQTASLRSGETMC